MLPFWRHKYGCCLFSNDTKNIFSVEWLEYACMYVCLCRVASYHGLGLSDEEELSEGTVQRQKDTDAGGVLTQAALHGGEELPQGPQQGQITAPVPDTQGSLVMNMTNQDVVYGHVCS